MKKQIEYIVSGIGHSVTCPTKQKLKEFELTRDAIFDNMRNNPKYATADQNALMYSCSIATAKAMNLKIEQSI